MAITDNFNRASLGANYETVLGTAWVTSGSVVAKPVSQYANTEIRRTESSFPNDQYAQVDTELTSGGGDGSSGGVGCRLDASGNGYVARINNTNNVTLYKVTGGAGAQTYLNDWVAVVLDNTLVTLKISASGTTIEVFCGGISLGTTSDSTFTSGKPGCFANTGQTSLLPRFDNFECTDASAAATSRQRMALLGVG